MDKVRLNRLKDQGIRFIQSVKKSSKVPLYAGNSGGKDSAVLDFLLRESGTEYVSQYSNTTIDPPGTIGHIRNHYKHTEIIQPELSFVQLLEIHGFPTRLKRFCCQHLKEINGAGKTTFLGIRAAESTKRAAYEPTMCDTRSWMQGAQKVYPLFTWRDSDVWDFIEFHDIPLAPCYLKGSKRLGCVACPLAGPTERAFELSLYPRFYNIYKKGIQKGMQNNPQWLISILTGGDGDLAMKWWLSGKMLQEYYRNQYEITGVRKGNRMEWVIKPNRLSFNLLNQIPPTCIMK